MTTLSDGPREELAVPPLQLEHELLSELPAFEQFFKTFGFKRVHGRVWGLLVLSEQPLSSKEIAATLGLSLAATSTTLNELASWGAIRPHFDSTRRCHLHAPVGNALSIVATVFKRREQVVFQQFSATASRALEFITKKHGERDPRVLTLRSIIATCNIAEAMMQLVFSAVQSAMNDSESVLSRAVQAAFKVGVGVPARWLFGEVAAVATKAAARGAPRPALRPDAASELARAARDEDSG
jgi:DNA-binding transcriptional regulator GbsR (MarR family)